MVQLNVLQLLFVLLTEGVEVEVAGHQWMELGREGVGEEGLCHRSTYCNSSAAVDNSVLLQTGQGFVDHTLTVQLTETVRV